MHLKYRSPDSQQRRGSVLRVIQLFLQIFQLAGHRYAAQLCQRGCQEKILHHIDGSLGESFRQFQEIVAREAVTDQHLRRPERQLPRFHIADKVDAPFLVGLFEQGKGLMLQFAVGPVCLMVFSTARDGTFAAALTMVLAVVLVDAFYIALAAAGASRLLNDPAVRRAFRIVSAVILALFGANIIAGALA